MDRVGSGGCSNKCQFTVATYADLNYDVLNIGKQEVWMGYETLQAMIDTTGPDFISANLMDIKTSRPLTKPAVIRDYGNLRVGLIGFLNPADFPKGTSLLDSTTMAIAPVMDAAKKYLPSLLRKTDAVVVLCELPSAEIDSLVMAYPQIALVISTGALRTGENVAQVNKTRVVGPGSSGYNGHYAVLEFDPAWGDSIGFTNFQDQLTETYDEQSVWADRLAAFEANPAAQAAPSKTAVTPSPTSVKPGVAPTPTSAQPHTHTGTTG